VSTTNTKTSEKSKEIFQPVQTEKHQTTNQTVKTNNTEKQPKTKKKRLRFKK